MSPFNHFIVKLQLVKAHRPDLFLSMGTGHSSAPPRSRRKLPQVYDLRRSGRTGRQLHISTRSGRLYDAWLGYVSLADVSILSRYCFHGRYALVMHVGEDKEAPRMHGTVEILILHNVCAPAKFDPNSMHYEIQFGWAIGVWFHRHLMQYESFNCTWRGHQTEGGSRTALVMSQAPEQEVTCTVELLV